MKHFFFAAVAMTAILAASCSKNADTNIDIAGNENLVTVTFGADASTRAFFDEVAAAETWESALNTVDMYVFGADGNLILKRVFSPAEVTAKSAVFALPHSAKGAACTFAVVANTDAGSIANYSALRSAIDNTPLDEYNGPAATVMTVNKRAGGFVMTGESVVTVGENTRVGVALKRNVAKIAVRTAVSDDFADKFNGGTVFIRSARIEDVYAASYLFDTGAYPGTAVYSFTQDCKDAQGAAVKDNLFYCYGTPVGAGQQIVLTGIFDADGNEATTGDQAEMEYKIALSGDGTGLIRRNGYYRVDATIKGLSGDGVIVTFTVADWETPVTQTVELGN